MIDLKTVNVLINNQNIDKVVELIAQSKVSETNRAKKLRKYAIIGNLKGIELEAETLRENAESLGLQRLANRAVELLRLTSLENKGQAYLQCQAITKLIATEIGQDFKAVSEATTF